MRDCEAMQQYLDSYISNELLVETNLEVQRHLEGCPACYAEFEIRSRLRDRLRAAVKAKAVPQHLESAVKQRLRAPRWQSWALAAACVCVCVGAWMALRSERLPSLADRQGQEAYIREVSSVVAAPLEPGLCDHIHCAVFRKYPENPPPAAEMEESLGAEFKNLVPVVQKNAPEGYRVVMAHQCSYAGRRFVHVTLKNGERVISLVIARKREGETLAGLGAQASGLVQAEARRYQIAGFESGAYLAWVVSDLKARANLRLAEGMAPGVREVLSRAGGGLCHEGSCV